MTSRPQLNETAEFYHNYISYVPDDFLGYLPKITQEIIDYTTALPEERLQYAYAPGKWTIAEVLIHLMDSERVFAYRALRIARGDTTPLPGFEQDDFVPYSRANERSKASVIAEIQAVHASTMSLFQQFSKEDLLRIGEASGWPASPRAIGFVIGGHATHHLNVLKERY